MGNGIYSIISNQRCYALYSCICNACPTIFKVVWQYIQQGLEKLNDFTTKFYQCSSNHRTLESLHQILEKHNRLELLEDNGYQRVKNVQCANAQATTNKEGF